MCTTGPYTVKNLVSSIANNVVLLRFFCGSLRHGWSVVVGRLIWFYIIFRHILILHGMGVSYCLLDLAKAAMVHDKRCSHAIKALLSLSHAHTSNVHHDSFVVTALMPPKTPLAFNTFMTSVSLRVLGPAMCQSCTRLSTNSSVSSPFSFA